MVPPVKRQMDRQYSPQLHITSSEDMNVMFTVSHNSRSLGLPDFSQSFTASKGSVTKIDLPLALRALTSSFANLDIAVNVKAEDSKTIMFYLLNEDEASTDYCPAVYAYSTFATKAITYNTIQ